MEFIQSWFSFLIVSTSPVCATREEKQKGRIKDNISFSLISKVIIYHLPIHDQPPTVNRQPPTANRNHHHRQPSTINHQPSTANRQPSTVNRQPYFFVGCIV
jgi:hypothetical protein